MPVGVRVPPPAPHSLGLPIDAIALVSMALLRTPQSALRGAKTVDIAKARLQIAYLAGLRRAAEGRILCLAALR
jgi:hypothetical protein